MYIQKEIWRAEWKEASWGEREEDGEREETEECLVILPIFLTRKQNLLETPTQQTCASACLTQLVTRPSIQQRGGSDVSASYKPMAHLLQVKTVLSRQTECDSAGLLDS